MEQAQLPDFSEHFQELMLTSNLLCQNNLLNEGELASFARDRGFNVWGVATGAPGVLHERGLLPADGEDFRGRPTFHPFRMYSADLTLQAIREDAPSLAAMRQDREFWIKERKLSVLPYGETVKRAAQRSNIVVGLAMFLEPLYWPRITGWQRRTGGLHEEEFHEVQEQFCQDALDFIRTLDCAVWQKEHETLRHDAAGLDENGTLYALLRLSHWDSRKDLKGDIAGALWLRHMAEVLRRGFEEAHGVQWLEEDQCYIPWPPRGRKFAFGSLRPLDDETAARPVVAWSFGLLTGSIVRWYVEGETEYYAILELFPKPERGNVEIVNLHGSIREGKNNVATHLGTWLKDDEAQRRFSMLTFDKDVDKNVEDIKRHVRDGKTFAYIGVHDPDFEFANFTLEELVEVAAQIDEARGASGEAVRQANWTGISKGGDFATQYWDVTPKQPWPQNLKGENWGRALAKYAAEHPRKPGEQEQRTFLRTIDTAAFLRSVNYDYQKERIACDPDTLKTIDLQAKQPATPKPLGE